MKHEITATQTQDWTSYRLAGAILLSCPISMVIHSIMSPVNQEFGGKDLGILLVIWFGYSLVKGRTGHRLSALWLSSIYYCLLSAVAVYGAISGLDELTLYTKIDHPQMIHFFYFWLFATFIFGIPAILLYRKNRVL